MTDKLDLLCFRGRPLGEWLNALAEGQPGLDSQGWHEIGEAIQSLALALIDTVKNHPTAVRLDTLQALRDLGEPLQTIPPVLRACLKEMALRDRDAAVRNEAVLALSRHLGPHSGQQIGELAAALKDEIPAVRLSAVSALAEVGPHAWQAVPPLIHTASWDPDPKVRVQAAVAVWRIDRRDRIAVPILVRGLQEHDEYIRWTAGDCLGDIGADAEEALGPLRAVLRDGDNSELVQQGLRLAIERIERALEQRDRE